MSTVSVQCTDQALAITNSPVIASGGINENYIQFSFCNLWAGYAKVCVFYQQSGSYYYSLVDADDKCLIPAECCTSAGKLHFGVMGSLDGVMRTSEVLTYRIVEGAMTEVDDPSPSIYQQLLDKLAEIETSIEENALVDGSVTTARLVDEAVTLEKLGSDVTPEGLGAAEVSHTHAQSDITGLQTALDEKAAISHTHEQSDVTGLSDALDGKAAATHTHEQSDITGLETALTNIEDDISEINTALDGKAASVHANTHGTGGADPITPASIGAVPASQKGAASGVSTLDANSKVDATQSSSQIMSASESLTLALSHAGKFIYMNSTSALTVTIPANASVAFPVGTEIEICRWSTGAVTIAAASGVTIYSIDSVKTISDRYGCVCLKKINTNGWLIAGALA